VPGKKLLCLGLLSASASMAATPGFLLGLDYGEWLDPSATSISTDGSGALYVLSSFPICGPACTPPSQVTKLSPDGKTILWRNQLGFAVYGMAVDPNGGVYLMPVSLPADTSLFVVKLAADGTGIAWKTPVGFLPAQPDFAPILAADSSGRAYLADVSSIDYADDDNFTTTIVRLNSAGSAVDYSAQVAGQAYSIAVDGLGAAFIAGGDFLARLAPDGSAGFNVALSDADSVALDASGDIVVLGQSGLLQRLDSTGAIMFSQTIGAGTYVNRGLALDAAGNAYITGNTYGSLYPVKNSLATCGPNFDLLSVFAPDGSLLQATLIPGGGNGGLFPFVVTSPDSTVFVVDSAAATFAPTQAGPFPSGAPSGTPGAAFVWHLAPNANAQTVSLVCLGSAATYTPAYAPIFSPIGTPIAPGEMVTLIGNGLGPTQGVATTVTLQSPLPQQVATAEVTFDGTPAPLMYVQDAQINAVVPWSLTPGQTAEVCVSYNGATTNCLTLPVAEAAPGVFAGALNQDGTLNSAANPAPVGSIVSVWATGLGPISPPQADGTLVAFPLPTNVLPVVVETGPPPVPPPTGFPFARAVTHVATAGGTTLDVTYAGPAPYLIAGESQINFVVVDSCCGFQIFLPSASGTGLGFYSQTFSVYVAGQ
jgi:uncharacterized protein (TIGR03437 family)